MPKVNVARLVARLQLEGVRESLQQLHSLVRLPGPTLTEAERNEAVKEKVSAILGDISHEVHLISHNQCKWFEACRSNKSATETTGTLEVVFAAPPVDSMDPFPSVDSQSGIRQRVTYKDWFRAFEIGHFLYMVHRSGLNHTEALLGWNAEHLFASSLLKSKVIDQPFSSWRSVSFSDSCTGRFITLMEENSTPLSDGLNVSLDDERLQKWCFGLRMLSYSSCMIHNEHPDVWRERLHSSLPGSQDDKYGLLTFLDTLKKGAVPSFREMRAATKQMKSDIRNSDVGRKRVHEVTSSMFDTLKDVRCSNVEIAAPPVLEESVEHKVRALLDAHDKRFSRLHPSQLMSFTIAGSHLNNLHTATSDEDYMGVFIMPFDRYIIKELAEKNFRDVILTTSSKSNEADVCLFEATKFVSTIVKGSIDAFQILFSDQDHLIMYENDMFKELKKERNQLLSERLVWSYVKCIYNHFAMLEEGRYTPSKIFFRIYHKLEELERLLVKKGPKVYYEGEKRDQIMRLREQPLEGDLAVDKLRSDAEERLFDIRDRFEDRTWRYPATSDSCVLRRWLIKAYGFPAEMADEINELNKPL